MNFDLFIAKRYLRTGKSGFSGPIVKIAVFSVSLGMAAMIVSIAVVSGFQINVREKVTGFGSHIQIAPYDLNKSYEHRPVYLNQPFYPLPGSLKEIRHIQVYATKAGIIKTDDQIEGVILKGIGNDFDWSFFREKIRDGAKFMMQDTVPSNDVLISATTARRLKLKTGDTFRMYFIISEELIPRGRKFKISGIYDTGLEDFDKLYVICDIRHIRKLNNWQENEVGGFEVFLHDFDEIDKVKMALYHLAGPELDVKSINELYPQIFEWLDLHDMNAMVIIILMLFISGITMISTLLVLILEHTNLIGILKALGARNRNIRKIMVINATYIIGKGLLWGNASGLGLCFIQLKTGFLKLDQESYYVPTVPVHLDPGSIVLLNALAFAFCFILLIVPSYVVTRIAPIKVIRFG